MSKVILCDAVELANSLPENSVNLLLTDPPYFGIVDDGWDNQWTSEKHFAEWLCGVFGAFHSRLTQTGSIVFFSCLGKHGSHPIFDIVRMLEGKYFFRQWITWRKRRAYGKSHDYLYTREEILWFSKSSDRTSVTFNIPYTSELRGYDGWDERYKPKSEFKRVSNVFTDIDEGTVIEHTEVMKPFRTAQKPVELMKRLVSTHSVEGDLVVDPFCGTGMTGKACKELKREFVGCDLDAQAIDIAKWNV